VRVPRWVASFGLAAAFFLERESASGQDTFGISSNTIVTLHSVDFQLAPSVGSDGLDLGNGVRSCTTGICTWMAALRLPAGAVITSMELSACDGDVSGGVLAVLLTAVKPAENLIVRETRTTGNATAPGCSTFPQPVSPTVIVDNEDTAYLVAVTANPGTNLGFGSLRVTYNLQVSPAPAVATFADVPVGHQQFRFIEALFASGITAGCGGGNFCPDAPVTRGQMAVFLSAALGLHFPN
jgi:hypothetical protein